MYLSLQLTTVCNFILDICTGHYLKIAKRQLVTLGTQGRVPNMAGA